MSPRKWRFLSLTVMWLVFAAASLMLFRSAHVFAPTSDTGRLGIGVNPRPLFLYAIVLFALIMLTVWLARSK